MILDTRVPADKIGACTSTSVKAYAHHAVQIGCAEEQAAKLEQQVCRLRATHSYPLPILVDLEPVSRSIPTRTFGIYVVIVCGDWVRFLIPHTQ